MRATVLIPFLAALATAAPAAAAVDLTGQSVSASFVELGPLVLLDSTPFSSPATVGLGVEFTGKATAITNREYTILLDVNSDGFSLSFTNTFLKAYNYTGAGNALFGVYLLGLSGIGAISLADYSCAGLACVGGDPGARVVTAISDASTAEVTLSALRAGETYRFKFADPAAAPPVSTAPEPAAWALMIAGFGLAGATLRRRRRLVA